MTLVSLSSAPTAVRAAANCFCQLLVSHSDNNVKLIVLDRLQVGGGGVGRGGWVDGLGGCFGCLAFCLPCQPLLACPPACPAPSPPRHPQELKDRHRDVMRELLMDVLRALATPNLDIRKKTLDIALDLIDARNIDEVRTGRWGWGWGV